MFRNSYVKIDLDNYRDNIRYLQSLSDKKLICVIKANGYGLVDHVCAKIAIEEGVRTFAVSSLDEAIALRKNGINEEILVLGAVESEYLDLVKEYDLSIITVSKDYVLTCANTLEGCKVHLKLNTGMNRLGVPVNEAKEVLQILLKVGAKVEGIMTHYCCADTDSPVTMKQYELFKQTVESLNYPFKYIHAAATDASLIVKDSVSNHIRCGIGMLGYSDYETPLKPCLSVYSEVVECKKVAKGEGISYGHHYISDGEGYIITANIGYADGIFRANTGKKVYIEGEEGTIVGSICMDQMMIHTEHYHKIETPIEIFGDHIDINKRAQELGTINYELIVALSDRLARVYETGGKIVKEIDPRFNTGVEF